MLTVNVNVDEKAIAAYADKYLQSRVVAEVENAIKRVTDNVVDRHIGRIIDEALNTDEFRAEVDKTVNEYLSAAAQKKIVLEALRKSMVRYAMRQAQAPRVD